MRISYNSAQLFVPRGAPFESSDALPVIVNELRETCVPPLTAASSNARFESLRHANWQNLAGSPPIPPRQTEGCNYFTLRL